MRGGTSVSMELTPDAADRLLPEIESGLRKLARYAMVPITLKRHGSRTAIASGVNVFASPDIYRSESDLRKPYVRNVRAILDQHDNPVAVGACLPDEISFRGVMIDSAGLYIQTMRFPGVVMGEVVRIARDMGVAKLPLERFMDWLADQAALLGEEVSELDLVSQENLTSLFAMHGIVARKLFVGLTKSGPSDFDEIVALSRLQKVMIVVAHDYVIDSPKNRAIALDSNVVLASRRTNTGDVSRDFSFSGRNDDGILGAAGVAERAIAEAWGFLPRGIVSVAPLKIGLDAEGFALHYPAKVFRRDGMRDIRDLVER